MTLLTDDQKMLQDTAASFLAEEGAHREAAPSLARHRLQGRLRPWPVEAVRRARPHRHLHSRKPRRHGPRCDRGGAGAGGDRPQPDALAVPHDRSCGCPRDRGHAARANAGIPGILSGEAVLALAVDEGPRHAPEQTALEAKRQGNGFVLNGAKQFVVQGGSADMIVTAARTSGSPGETDGLTLFAVPKDAAGLEVENVALVDSSKAARLDVRQCRARRRRGDRRGRWRLAAASPRAATPATPARPPSWSASRQARRR